MRGNCTAGANYLINSRRQFFLINPGHILASSSRSQIKTISTITSHCRPETLRSKLTQGRSQKSQIESLAISFGIETPQLLGPDTENLLQCSIWSCEKKKSRYNILSWVCSSTATVSLIVSSSWIPEYNVANVYFRTYHSDIRNYNQCTLSKKIWSW